MTPLPSSERLTSLVSNVTETMFGLSFSLTDGRADIPGGASWRMAVLPIRGARPLTIAIASDPGAAAVLGGAMFGVAPAQVDPQMVDDSLSELVNIVAGQIKSLMDLDQALGLPAVVSCEAMAAPERAWRGATMRSGDTELLVWVAISESTFQRGAPA